MEDDEMERISKIVYSAIFNDSDDVEIDGEIYPIELTSRSKLRKVSFEGLTFLEQNPMKDTQWAEKAREGHRIMWVMRGRKYLVRVMDGKYLKLH